MRTTRLCLLLLPPALAILLGVNHCQETRYRESSKAQDRIGVLERIEEMMNLGHNFGECYREYFALAPKDDVRRNRFSNSPSFSAQCAWRASDASGTSRKKNGEPADASLVWFVGFVEGKAAIDIPVWWEEFLFANGARGGLPWGLEGIMPPPKTSFEGISESIRQRFQADLDGKWHSFVVTRGRGRIVIARFTELGVDGNLWCFDENSEKLLWIRRGPECRAAGVAGGPTDYRVTMDIMGEEVLLAGAGSSYTLHVFNIETGATRFLFCSLY